MIRFENVSFRYEGSPATSCAVCDLSLEFGADEMVAVLGANGSGKSTAVKLCNGLLLPTSGRVMVDGLATDDPAHAVSIRSRVGMVFQDPDDQIVATSVEDEVAFGPENLGLARDEIRARVDAAIAATGLTGLERREPHLLSGGQKQRLAIAGALAMRPHYLVMDEPTSMIDARGRDEVACVLAQVRAEGRGVVLITHDVAEALSADRVVVLSAGRVAFSGSVTELLERSADFGAWGLEVPALARLAADLERRGLGALRGAATIEEIVGVLCP